MDRSGIEDLEGTPRWRLVAIAVAAVVAVIVGFFVYRSVFSGSDNNEESFTEYVVGKMTIRNMVTTSGVAISQEEAILGFPVPGQVEEILVELGQEVHVGQPLVRVDADALENTVSTAESGLAMARLQLQKMLEGATDAEIRNSEDAIEAARAALVKALNDRRDALDPPDEAELSAADQAIAAAQAALSTAESKLQTVRNGASEADVAAAESQVVQAETNYNQAENAEGDSQENMENAQTGFDAAAGVYCTTAEEYCDTWNDIEDICDYMEDTNYQEPLDSEQIDTIVACVEPTPGPTRTRTPTPTATPEDPPTPDPSASPTPTHTPLPTRRPLNQLEQDTSDFVYANTGYRNSITAVDNAAESLRAAEAALNAANLALLDLLDGATAEDIAAAEDAVMSAQSQLVAAFSAKNELINGPSDTTIENLEAAILKAQTGFTAAISARDELIEGATRTEISLQEEEVHQAGLAVDKARISLDEATLTAPFDGVVSALPVKLGEFVTSQTPAVTILTPGLLVFELNIGETELAEIKVGQWGGVLFDAIPGKIFGIQIAAVGLSPTTEQGVVIYKVRAAIRSGLDDPEGPKPVPGMNGSASIVTKQKADVIGIPVAFVRERSGQKTVELVVDGEVQLQPVETGLSDGAENVEIVSGLKEGDILAQRSVGGQQGEEKEKEELPAGIR